MHLLQLWQQRACMWLFRLFDDTWLRKSGCVSLSRNERVQVEVLLEGQGCLFYTHNGAPPPPPPLHLSDMALTLLSP